MDESNCKEILLADTENPEILIHIRHKEGGLNAVITPDLLAIDQLNVKHSELIEGTMEDGRFTCLKVSSYDAGWLIENLERKQWTLVQGRPAICENFIEGKPMVNRTIYSS